MTRGDRIIDEAALWLVRVQNPELSAADREEFVWWLAASAEHVREYLSLAAITQDISELPATPDVDALIDLARLSGDASNIVSLGATGAMSVEATSTDDARAVAAKRRHALWGTAATLMLSVCALLAWLSVDVPQLYTTGVGEQRSFSLDDGSVVTLNAQSSLELVYSATGRDVKLREGEALFDVARDPGRPFRVLTRRVTIEAIGTQFNVRSRGDDTTVTVLEGTVDVAAAAHHKRQSGEPDDVSGRAAGAAASSGDLAAANAASKAGRLHAAPVRLTVGKQARVSAGEIAVVDTSLEKATSWRQRRLVFESRALSDVVKEFNLYNDRKFLIDDAVLANRPISGAFSADDRESFALFLEEAGLAEIERRGDGSIVLRPAVRKP